MARYVSKKQELIEQITKMLEPYENIDSYSFTINLYIKENECKVKNIQISFNDYAINPYCQSQLI